MSAVPTSGACSRPSLAGSCWPTEAESGSRPCKSGLLPPPPGPGPVPAGRQSPLGPAPGRPHGPVGRCGSGRPGGAGDVLADCPGDPVGPELGRSSLAPPRRLPQLPVLGAAARDFWPWPPASSSWPRDSWPGAWGLPWCAASSSVFWAFWSSLAGRRSEEGRQTLAALLGLRRYLCTVDRKQLHRILRQNPGYYYDMAPYALALWIDRQFARPGLTGCACPPAPGW